jgi:hypothetical protein
VNRFDSLTATVVLVVVSRVMQAKLNRPPEGEIPAAKVEKLSRGAVKQMHSMRREAKVARNLLKQYRPSGVIILESSARSASQ